MNRVGALKGPNDIKFILNDQGSGSGQNLKNFSIPQTRNWFSAIFWKARYSDWTLAINPILMGRWPTLTRTFFNIG